MVLNQLLVFGLISFFVLLSTLLFFITLTSVFDALLKSFLGDETAVDEGYASLNPFFHMDIVWVLLYIALGVFVLKNQPYTMDNFSGSLKKNIKAILMILGPSLLNFVISSLALYCGIKYLGKKFFIASIHAPHSISSDYIAKIIELFREYNGIKIIGIIFLIITVTINMYIGLINILFSSFHYLFNRYIAQYYTHNIEITLFLYLIITIAIIYYSSTINIIMWSIIAYPSIGMLA